MSPNQRLERLAKNAVQKFSDSIQQHRGNKKSDQSIFLDQIIQDMIALNSHMKERQIQSSQKSPEWQVESVKDPTSKLQTEKKNEFYDADWDESRKLQTEGKDPLESCSDCEEENDQDDDDDERDSDISFEELQQNSLNIEQCYNKLYRDPIEKERQRKLLIEKRQKQLEDLGWDESDPESNDLHISTKLGKKRGKR